MQDRGRDLFAVPREAWPPFEVAAERLSRLHRCGVVHGDLHCGNLVLDADGRLSFIDLANDWGETALRNVAMLRFMWDGGRWPTFETMCAAARSIGISESELAAAHERESAAVGCVAPPSTGRPMAPPGWPPRPVTAPAPPPQNPSDFAHFAE